MSDDEKSFAVEPRGMAHDRAMTRVILSCPEPPRLTSDMSSVAHFRKFVADFEDYEKAARRMGGDPDSMVDHIARPVRYAIAGDKGIDLKELTEEHVREFLAAQIVPTWQQRSSWRSELGAAIKGKLTIRDAMDRPETLFLTACGAIQEALDVSGLSGWSLAEEEPVIGVKEQLIILAQELPEAVQQQTIDLVRRHKFETIYAAKELFAEAIKESKHLVATASSQPTDGSRKGRFNGRRGGRRGRNEGGGYRHEQFSRKDGAPEVNTGKRYNSDVECWGCGECGHPLSRCPKTTAIKKLELYGDKKIPRRIRDPTAAPTTPTAHAPLAASAPAARARKGTGPRERGRSSSRAPPESGPARNTRSRDKSACALVDEGSEKDHGRVLITIPGCAPTELPAKADSGAETSVITRAAVQLIAGDPSMFVTDSAWTLRGVDGRSVQDESKQICNVQIAILSVTGAKTKTVRTDLQIVNGEAPLVLLSSKECHELGAIPPEAQLWGRNEQGESHSASKSERARDAPSRIDQEMIEIWRIKNAFRQDEWYGDDDGERQMLPRVSEKIGQYLDKVMQEARENGASEDYIRAVAPILEKYVASTVMSPFSPAKNVEPLRVELKEGAQDVHCKARPLNEWRAAACAKELDELEELGIIERTRPGATGCSSPVLVVGQPPMEGETGARKVRLVVDLRRVNNITKGVDYPAPSTEELLQNMPPGAGCLAKVDLKKAYYQIPLTEESRRLFGIMTPWGRYQLTRMAMGGKQSGAHLQAVLDQVFHDRDRSAVKIYVDDILLAATSEKELAQYLKYVFDRLIEHGLMISIDKLTIFAHKLVFLGKEISAEGVRPDPRKVQGLVDMPQPTSVQELQSFLCMAGYMRTHIPRFASISKPLFDIVNSRLSRLKGGARKRAKAANLVLDDRSLQVWKEVKQALADAVVNCPRRREWRIGSCSDASDSGWGAFIYQFPEEDLQKKMSDRKLEILTVLSGSFKNASENWSTADKEGFGLMQPFIKRRELMLTPPEKPVMILTDHRNLKWIFAPKSIDSRATNQQVGRLGRWARELSLFEIDIDHISGGDNDICDYLSRGGNASVAAFEVLENDVAGDDPSADMEKILLGIIPDGEAVISRGDIVKAQAKAIAAFTEEDSVKFFKKMTKDDNDNLHRSTDDGKVWIPPDDREVWLRLIVCAHAGGPAGHRSKKSTLKAMTKFFISDPGLLSDMVDAFVGNCMVCMKTDCKENIPRPWGRQLQAEKANDILCIDFYDVGVIGDQGFRYICVLKDKFSRMVRLYPTRDKTAFTACECVAEWVATYGVPNVLLSDGGTHFTAEIMEKLRVTLGMDHHITTPYCAWANGAVERVMKELTRLLRMLLTSSRGAPETWPKLTDSIQMILNNRTSDVLDGLAPVQVFLDRQPIEPLSFVVENKIKGRTWDTIPLETVAIQRATEALHRAIEDQHARVLSSQENYTRRNERRREAKSRGIDIEIGDFVVVSFPVSRRKKTGVIWKGPMRVTRKFGPLTFEVQDILNGEKKSRVHAQRLKKFRTKDAIVREEWREQAAYDGEGFQLESLTAVQEDPHRGIIIQAKWSGFEALTWETVEAIADEDPAMLSEFLERTAEECSDDTFREKIRLALQVIFGG